MKHIPLLLLAVLVTVSAFNNFLFSSKSNLANLIQLDSFEGPRIAKQKGREVILVKVYSTYPFNHQNLLTVNAGEINGVKPGMAVTADGNTLIGRVVEVLENKSIVQTIFDQNFSLSVRFGEQAANALLVGGSTPRLALIEKSVEIKEGDAVYSASREFLYGMAVGRVGAIGDSSGDSLREAILTLTYQVDDLREAAILLK